MHEDDAPKMFASMEEEKLLPSWCLGFTLGWSPCGYIHLDTVGEGWTWSSHSTAAWAGWHELVCLSRREIGGLGAACQLIHEIHVLLDCGKCQIIWF